MKRFLLAIFLISTLFFSVFAEDDESLYSPYGYQSNFSFYVCDTYDFSGQKDYLQGKISIDLAEGWFGRWGIYTSIGVDLGGQLDSKVDSSTIATVFTPDIGVSYYLNPKLIVSGGFGLSQTWYKTTEEKTHTTIYSCGLAVPVKLRYYIFDNFAVTGSLIPMLQPGTPEEKGDRTKSRLVFVTQFNLGVTLSVPSRRL